MALEIEELVKVFFAFIFFAILVSAAYLLLGEKGGELIGAIRNALRFG